MSPTTSVPGHYAVMQPQGRTSTSQRGLALVLILLAFVTGVPQVAAAEVVAWGYNAHGQTTIPGGLTGVTAIAAGGFHTVALKSDGTVVAWGRNNHGQTTIPGGLTGVKIGRAHV